MADIFSRRRRSEIMGRIGPKHTTPELAVRRIVHQLGYRFRLHRGDLPGSPDLVLARHRLAIQVHGCFWHRHSGCANCTTPKTRPEFWAAKFAGNVRRDKRTSAALRALGWHVATIWECQTENETSLRRRLKAIFDELQ
jgi:DNA mismatch endonuclease (patch repair protein)